MRTEWSGSYGGVYLRLTAYGDGAVRVTRDRSGAFRGNAVSAVCAKADGGWKRSADAEGDMFSLPGFSVRVNKTDGTLTFLRADGETLLREQSGKLESTEIVINEFDSGTSVRETSSADGARASAAPAKQPPAACVQPVLMPAMPAYESRSLSVVSNIDVLP